MLLDICPLDLVGVTSYSVSLVGNEVTTPHWNELPLKFHITGQPIGKSLTTMSGSISLATAAVLLPVLFSDSCAFTVALPFAEASGSASVSLSPLKRDASSFDSSSWW